MPESMTEAQARKEALDILGEEANQLAIFETEQCIGDAPHRVKIAIGREIKRLRLIAQALEGE